MGEKYNGAPSNRRSFFHCYYGMSIDYEMELL